MPGFLRNPDAGKDSADVVFAIADWAAGTPNEITILASGAPAAGQVGPHGLIIGTAYSTTVFQKTGATLFETVGIRVDIDTTTGNLTIHKTGLTDPFDGRIVVEE